MKRGLSKNLLRMKFMQRTAMEAEKQQSLADRVITSEEWRYDPALLAGLPDPPPLRGVVCRPDHLPCVAPGTLGRVLPLQPAGWGRVSYGGFNPAVEKLMAECGRGDGGTGVCGVSGAVAVALDAEAGATVSAEQMTQQRRQRQRKLAPEFGGGVDASLARKFETKRARKRRIEETEEASKAPAAAGEEAEAAESAPEEGELDEAEAGGHHSGARRLQRKKLKKMKKKMLQQQQQQQQQQQRQQGLSTKKAKLPHPSTLLAAGRKRKAQVPPNDDED